MKSDRAAVEQQFDPPYVLCYLAHSMHCVPKQPNDRDLERGKRQIAVRKWNSKMVTYPFLLRKIEMSNRQLVHLSDLSQCDKIRCRPRYRQALPPFFQSRR